MAGLRYWAAALVLFMFSTMTVALPATHRLTDPTTKPPNRTESSTTASTPTSTTTDAPKKVITYILGQPGKTSIQSPAELLSPDRYEFYTFDDDGKIIKKLMNVEEIQRIIANSKAGLPIDTQNVGDYYQLLTVTPDVTSVPAVRINPNEPLFSIHDVIASVQNVLKAEIKEKFAENGEEKTAEMTLTSESTENVSGSTTTTAEPTTTTENPVIVVKKPTSTTENPVIVVKKPTSTTEKPVIVVKKPTSTTEKPVIVVKKPTSTTEKPVIVVKKPTSTTQKPVDKKPIATVQPPVTPLEEIMAELKNSTEPSIGKPTMVEILRVTSSVSQSSSPSSQVPAATTIKATEQTTLGTIVVTEIKANDLEVEQTEVPSAAVEPLGIPEQVPLSLLDAHPGLYSNESFTDGPTLAQSLFTMENQLFDNPTLLENATDATNLTTSESVLSQVQIPMNQDLAESVSSVLSQIANEISIESLKFDETFQTTTISSLAETTTTQPTEPTTIIITTTEEEEEEEVEEEEQEVATTNSPASWLKDAQDVTLDETGTETLPVTTEEIPTTRFMPQNQPRPFSKPTTTEAVETTLADQPETTTYNAIESRTEQDETTTLQVTTVWDDETSTVSDALTTTPVPEKKNDQANRLQVIESNGNTSSSIEIIQEAETGRIPRPTQRPEEIATRPGSAHITTVAVPSSQSTNKGNTLETSSTTLTPVTVTSLPTTVQQPSTDSDEDAETISISFMPMEIRPSSSSTTTSTTTTTTESPKAEDTLESKIISEEIIEKSAAATAIASSHKVVIGAITSEPTTKDPPAAAQKQNYVRPQGFVKPQKPVFIKPAKGKPQPLKTEPNKPVRPASHEEDQRPYETPLLSSPSALELDQAPDENLGLEATTLHLEPDVRDFVNLCNELAFSLWSSITHNGLSFVRSVVVSPFAVTSLLAMVFLGARGPTSGQMNDILKLDDVVTFNPHLVFRNVTESLVIARHPGVATAAFVRELYSDRTKGKLLDFYKERAQQFYDGHVEEVNFKAIGETLRRQTNHLIKRQTWGKVKDFLQGSTLMLRAPLAAFSANIFQADCSRASIKDRDGEMYFVVLPSNRLRRLVPIPAAVWREDFLAGYEPNLDATAAAIGSVGGIVSTIFVMPGQQGLIAPGDSLARLEHHLLGSSFKRGHWERLMRSLLRRPGLELQVPRISHKSVVNVTASLQKMGLRDLFSAEKADLTGLNGLANDLHLSDMLQVNQFSTCGDEPSNNQAHSEFYPATPLSRREKSADNVFAESIESLFAVSDFEDPTIAALPLELRPRQARIPSGRSPEPPRLRLDRPFLFFVRHNPTGLILHVGRFNPRLMH